MTVFPLVMQTFDFFNVICFQRHMICCFMHLAAFSDGTPANIRIMYLFSEHSFCPAQATHEQLKRYSTEKKSGDSGGIPVLPGSVCESKVIFNVGTWTQISTANF